MPAAPDGTIEVTLHGQAAALAAAVNKVGGRSIASAGDARTAIVPRSALATLARTPGVTAVRRPVRAYPDAVSEGVAASRADTWQSAGRNGAGVKVGIVDVGFANLSAELTAGNLPSSQVHYVDDPNDPNNQNHCGDENTTDHGTAVAEIVHQMAPDADLYLYCIDSTVGFQQAEQQIQTAGDIKIVNSSLSFPGDSRGDGTGSADSAATTVKSARQAGILWIQSAGNNALDHWSGTLRDADRDRLVDLDGTTCQGNVCNEVDAVDVIPGGSGAAVLKWDDWPTVPSPAPQLTLDAYGYQCNDARCSTVSPLNGGNPLTDSQEANQAPVLSIALPTNSSGFDQEWDILVQIGTGVPAVSYDLSYWGSVTNSFLSSVNPTRAATGSITEPASSPSAFAVGAAGWQACGLENFSSRGPTIDGRVKPDITGFDGTSSNLAGLNPFFGTSAAAPHVAGAAALVAGANPSMDADQIENSLESLAGTSPPLNTVGHGVLNLGAPQTPGQPAVTGVSPANSAVGTTVTISGSGFLAGDTTVKFGAVSSNHVTVACATRLVASVPASTGTVDVTVAAQGGTSATTSADRFTYQPLVTPLVTAAVDPQTKGYWLATPKGNVYQFGATWYGSKAGVSLPAPIVSMAADPASGGYWLVTSKGNVYNFNAPWYGSLVGKTLPAPVVSITSSGPGYLLTTSKGNVYNFNAPFYGSMAGKSLPAPVIGAAADPATGGYWLNTPKGNVYNFNAPWYGSAAGTSLPAPVVTINTSGKIGTSNFGYVLTTSAGNVLHYNADYHGSPVDPG
ncbi:MAG TPA: S8 family serine peptidase [Jatrophihabitantaceae bacterium]